MGRCVGSPSADESEIRSQEATDDEMNSLTAQLIDFINADHCDMIDPTYAAWAAVNSALAAL